MAARKRNTDPARGITGNEQELEASAASKIPEFDAERNSGLERERLINEHERDMAQLAARRVAEKGRAVENLEKKLERRRIKNMEKAARRQKMEEEAKANGQCVDDNGEKGRDALLQEVLDARRQAARDILEERERQGALAAAAAPEQQPMAENPTRAADPGDDSPA